MELNILLNNFENEGIINLIQEQGLNPNNVEVRQAIIDGVNLARGATFVSFDNNQANSVTNMINRASSENKLNIYQNVKEGSGLYKGDFSYENLIKMYNKYTDKEMQQGDKIVANPNYIGPEGIFGWGDSGAGSSLFCRLQPFLEITENIDASLTEEAELIKFYSGQKKDFDLFLKTADSKLSIIIR